MMLTLDQKATDYLADEVQIYHPAEKLVADSHTGKMVIANASLSSFMVRNSWMG